jgi:hypothetical protein
LKHHRLNPETIGNHGLFRIYCATAALAGLLFMAGHAIAGSLWVANEGSPTITEFNSELKDSKHAHRIIDDINDLDGSSTIAFQGGNLWVTNFDGNTITEFSQSQLNSLKAHTSDLTVAVTISEDAGNFLDGPEGIVFDSSNNMWIGAEDGQVVLEYTPEQYAANGSPTPNIILNADTFSFSSPSHLAFDSAGNLWVTDEDLDNGNGGTGEIFRYTKSQISGLKPGTNNVDPVFGIGYSQFGEPETLAFDGSGNLWVADEQDNTVDQFSASQLAGTGLGQNLTPRVVLSSRHIGGPCSKSFDGPYGVAVNQNGNLLVSSATVKGGCLGSIAEFSVSKIGSSGSPEPKVFVTTNPAGTSIDSPNALTIQP